MRYPGPTPHPPRTVLLMVRPSGRRRTRLRRALRALPVGSVATCVLIPPSRGGVPRTRESSAHETRLRACLAVRRSADSVPSVEGRHRSGSSRAVVFEQGGVRAFPEGGGAVARVSDRRCIHLRCPYERQVPIRNLARVGGELNYSENPKSWSKPVWWLQRLIGRSKSDA